MAQSDAVQLPTRLSDVSVVIVVSGRHAPLDKLFEAYRSAISGVLQDPEFVFVLDGDNPEGLKQLEPLLGENRIKIVLFARTSGEATALSASLDHCSGRMILTLPSFEQVRFEAIPDLIKGRGDSDMAVGRRWPRSDSAINRFMTKAFGSLLTMITGHRFQDVGCGVRLVKREVLEELAIYGEQHRFLPILAAERGYRVNEVALQQSDQDAPIRISRPGIYIRRLLDLITVFFLTRFARKPLRFFGLIGSVMMGIGIVILSLAIFQRLVYGIALGDRPALLLGTLTLVLGVQTLALGLVGELLIFSHADSRKDYAVAEVIDAERPDQVAEAAAKEAVDSHG